MTRPEAETLRYVICIDRRDGSVRWQTECAASPLLGSTALTSAASPTPVTDGEHIFACFGEAGTYCLDRNGKLVWSNTNPVPQTHYKAGSSPILWNDLVIVSHDTDSRSYTVALDKRDGSQRWVAERPGANGRRARVDAYATPIALQIDGVDQLIHDSFRRIIGYDPATGRELWSVRTDAEQIVTSPVAQGNTIIFAGECNHPIHFSAIRLSVVDDEWVSTSLWESRNQVPVVCSPVVHENRVYAVSKNGIATCRDFESGSLLWRERLSGKYYASIAFADGRLYVSNLDGQTIVLAAGDEARIIAVNPLDDPIFASPAVCGRELFIRSITHLYCIADAGTKDSPYR